MSTGNSGRKAFSCAIALLTILAGVGWLASIGHWPGPGYLIQAPHWIPTFGQMALGILSLTGTFVGLRHRKMAAAVLLIPAAVLALWWATSLGQQTVAEPFGASKIKWEYAAFWLLLVPGTFWLVTSWLGWPPTLKLPLAYRRLLAVIAVLCASVVIESAMLSLRSRDFPHCHGSSPPFTKQRSPRQAVFTARVFAKGFLWPKEWQGQGAPMKYWALAIVDRHFWGLPWWNHKAVMLMLETNGGEFFHEHDIDFVEAARMPGPLTRFLPIYDLTCSRTRHLEDAGVDLRVLRDGPPVSGIRILGRTIRAGEERWIPVPHAQVEIYSHTTGRFTVTSDDAAIYDVSGLPAGSYDIRAVGRTGWNYECCDTTHRTQQSENICDCTVFIP